MPQYNTGKDAAFPKNLVGDTDIILGYLAAPNAYNAWHESDWAQFKQNYKVPIWVGAFGGETEAANCVAQLRALGVPPGKEIIADMETRVDRTYLDNFGKGLHAAGYKVLVYGSVSTVFNNPPLNGYAVADPTGTPHMYNHPAVRMTQYAFGTRFDLDLVKHWLIEQDDFWK